MPRRNDDSELTPKQEVFAQHLARSKTVREAAAEAGYTYATGRNLACKEKVKARIKAIQSTEFEQRAITGDNLIDEIAALAFSDITEALQMPYDRLSELPARVRRAIAEVKVTHHYDKFGELSHTTCQLKMHNKNQAQQLLASILDPKPSDAGAQDSWRGLTVITGGKDDGRSDDGTAESA